MHFLLLRPLRQVYVLLRWEWRWVHPDKTPTRYPCVHCFVRRAAQQGRPEEECRFVAVPEAMLRTQMEEIPLSLASQYDPHLVEFACRCQAYPPLAPLLTRMPRGTLLQVSARPTTKGYLCEVFLAASSLNLTPRLSGLFPGSQLEHPLSLFVSSHGSPHEAATLLTQAIATRLWGEKEEVPRYPFVLLPEPHA